MSVRIRKPIKKIQKTEPKKIVKELPIRRKKSESTESSDADKAL
jgi:hypothetical protein